MIIAACVVGMCATHVRPGERMTDLGAYGDLLDGPVVQTGLYPRARPGPGLRRRIREALGCDVDRDPGDARVERRWVGDGVVGEEVSWSVGYGPRTRAWVLRPEGVEGALPGVLALHDHGGAKYFGKEKIADDDRGPPAALEADRARAYGGRAFANALARAGFVVLAADVFLWGSRRFDVRDMPASVREAAAGSEAMNGPLDEVTSYNIAAAHHEHVVAKYCAALGTSLAGIIGYEDRVAARYLAARSDVVPGRIGCAGLSGGGARAAVLQATCEAIGAAVIVGMMSAQAFLLARHVVPHSWMFFPPGLARLTDWPDLAAANAPSPLLVQYNRQDDLFPPAGMAAAHERLSEIYLEQGAPSAYRGSFFDGPHKFDLVMQDQAFAWLKDWL